MLKSCLLIATLVSAAVLTSSAQTSTEQQDWIKRSNENAQILLQVTARFSPEYAGQTGVEGVDEQIIDLRPGYRERVQKAIREALAQLEQKLQTEKDPLVRQDLEISIKATRERLRGLELEEKYEIPSFNMNQLVFGGLRALLDDQVAPERRKAAVVRLRKYAGTEQGYAPVTVLAEQRIRERLSVPGLQGPARAEVEKQLETADFFINGIGELFKKYKLEGWEQPYAQLRQQLVAYNDFVRKEVLPRARQDFRLPPEVYQFSLQTVGIDIPADELARRAHAAFNEIQQQMQKLAPAVAKQRGFSATDYRDVVRELKKDQLVGEAILPHYQSRLKDLETIIKRENLVSLPDRPARIRLASPAESASVPAPNMRPPRLIGNKGEQGEFVLPLSVPTGKGGDAKRFDDFTFTAASWTLTAHEARPGHEMQFASMVERGVTIPRAVFAFNSVNVEGWGLYAEYITFPYMPPDGQLISLQHRLMRAARAFLDPELQSGKITPEQALRVLKEDVVLSDAMANQEVERYTFRSPGQAPSYFYGYTRLVELRKDAEQKLGPKFDARKFHDFILSQGLLPPDMMRRAVMEQFVGSEKAASRSASSQPGA